MEQEFISEMVDLSIKSRQRVGRAIDKMRKITPGILALWRYQKVMRRLRKKEERYERAIDFWGCASISHSVFGLVNTATMRVFTI